jgi:hypothetical protein
MDWSEDDFRAVRRHPLVLRTEECIRSKGKDLLTTLEANNTYIDTFGVDCLHLLVSPGTLSKALEVWNSFLYGLEARGFRVEISRDKYSKRERHLCEAVILNQKFGLHLFEPFSFEYIDPGPPQPITTLKFPSGNICFKINGRSSGEGIRWKVKSPLKTWIDSAIDRFTERAEERNQRAIEVEERWIAAAPERYKKAKADRIERYRCVREKTLLEGFESWDRSQRLLKYIELHRTGSLCGCVPTEDWLKWALDYARKMNRLGCLETCSPNDPRQSVE